MSIISVTDNENNRWKRKTKKTKKERNKGVTQAIVKVWQLNNLVVRLSLIWKYYLICKLNLELALLIILKETESYES